MYEAVELSAHLMAYRAPRQIKPATLAGFVVAIIFTALWVGPLLRAVNFFRDARAVFAGVHSINAANDLWFSGKLLASYSVSLLASFVVARTVSRVARLILIVPMGILGFAVAEVIKIRPESPIVLFPLMVPWRPAFISMVAVSVALLIRLMSHRAGRC